MAIKLKKLQPLLDEDTSASTDTINVSGTSGVSYSADYGAIPSITVSDLSDLTLGNITSTTYTVGSGLNLNGSNAVWTTSGTNYNWSGIGTVQPSATISLKGEDADIDINGKSMKSWMEQVEERLNMLTANPQLEAEWDELRELGDRYRELEKKCKEKAEVWKKLKSMPPPSLD